MCLTELCRVGAALSRSCNMLWSVIFVLVTIANMSKTRNIQTIMCSHYLISRISLREYYLLGKKIAKISLRYPGQEKHKEIKLVSGQATKTDSQKTKAKDKSRGGKEKQGPELDGRLSLNAPQLLGGKRCEINSDISIAFLLVKGSCVYMTVRRQRAKEMSCEEETF